MNKTNNGFAKSQKISPIINFSLRALTYSLNNSYIAFPVVRFFLNQNCSSNNNLLLFKCPNSLLYITFSKTLDN